MSKKGLISLSLAAALLGGWYLTSAIAHPKPSKKSNSGANTTAIFNNAAEMVVAGQQTFRFGTFGDEGFLG